MEAVVRKIWSRLVGNMKNKVRQGKGSITLVEIFKEELVDKVVFEKGSEKSERMSHMNIGLKSRQ